MVNIDKIRCELQPCAGVYYPALPDRVFLPGVAVSVILNGAHYMFRFTIKNNDLVADSSFRSDDCCVLNHLLDSKQLMTIKQEALKELRSKQH